MSVTRDIVMDRGETKVINCVVKDATGQPVNLTGYTITAYVTPDLKVAPTNTYANGSGILLGDQTAATGSFTWTIPHVDSKAFVALGLSDPYLYNVVLADGSGNVSAFISTSRLIVNPVAGTPA